MTAFITDFPRKSSRTRTHAVIVPRTALIRETTSAATRVSLSAATASGLEIASQKPCDPPLVDSKTTAASGSRTMIVRKVVIMPRDRAVPALSLGARTGRAAAEATLASDPADLFLDSCHHALVRIEELRLHLGPAAESEVVDGEEVGSLRELLAVRLEHALDDRAVAVVREHLLGSRRLQEPDELVRLVLVLAGLDHGDRVLDQDRRLRNDVLNGLLGKLSGDRLVLVREEHVALPREERVQRVSGARVLHGDVLEQRQQLGPGLGGLETG